MNKNQHIIVIDEKDKTAQISSHKSLNKDLIEIRFLNSPQKPYKYSKNRVCIEKVKMRWEKDVLPVCGNKVITYDVIYEGNKYIRIRNGSNYQAYRRSELELMTLKEKTTNFENRIIYLDGIPQKEIGAMYDYGKNICVQLRSGKRLFYSVDRVQLAKRFSESEDLRILGYFKKLAKLENRNLKEFLKIQFAEIRFLSDATALYWYLKAIPPKRMQNQQRLIYPFPFSLSQMEAVENAFTATASIIEGPPGTGKTQTILNIILNLVIKNKCVAVVSNNNTAIKNVQEKLEGENLDFMTALLGNKENQEAFFKNQPSFPNDYPHWKLSKEEQRILSDEIEQVQNSMKTLLHLKNQQAKCSRELLSYKKEKEHFNNYIERLNFKELTRLSFYKQSPKRIISFLVDHHILHDQNKEKFLLSKLKFLIKHGFYRFKELEAGDQRIILQYQKLYYEHTIKTLQSEITALKHELEKLEFENNKQQCTEKAKKLLKAKLFERYKAKMLKRPQFCIKNFKKQAFKKFIHQYPVILSTTYSLRSSVLNGYLFDYLIIDEASQVNLTSACLALSVAKNIVVVGDLNQLPHIVDNEVKKQVQDKCRGMSIPPAYDFVKNSILSSFQKLYQSQIPKTLLKEHFRCHPKIIQFCNMKYYNNQLIPFTKAVDSDSPLQLWETVPGGHMRIKTRGEKGLLNVREVEVVEDMLKSGKLYDDSDKNMGFITPYVLQVKEAQNRIANVMEKDTVHKYQGREKNIIVFSTVLDNTREGKCRQSFINDNMVNVAVSRASKQFILLTGYKVFKGHGTSVGDLRRYMEYNGGEECAVQSNRVSVFDLLYKDFSKILITVKKKMKKVSKYTSENAMNYVIEKVLKETAYECFASRFGVRVVELIDSKIDLSKKEEKFVRHSRTHVDFAIYNKYDKRPVMVIEVDGFKYHHNNPDQLKRDKIKDDILRKNGLPILRVATHESGEEEKFRRKLDEVKEKANI